MTEFDQRTGLEVMSTEECWEHLLTSNVGRLAVTIGPHPDIFPVNYSVENGSAGSPLLIRTAPGTKLAAAVLGTAIAFEIDDIEPDRHIGWSVVVHGYATEIEDMTERDQLNDSDFAPKPWVSEDVRTRLIRLHANEVSGRRVPSSS